VPLHFTSDLTFSVEGADGSSALGRVEGDGSTLRVSTTDAALVWGAALDSTLATPRSLDRLATQLADEGVTVEIAGPAGRVATVGAGIDSTWGRVAAGSRRVRPGGARATVPLARAQARRLVVTHREPLLLVLAALVAAAVLRATRRRVAH
jgi:hypothetical protein